MGCGDWSLSARPLLSPCGGPTVPAWRAGPPALPSPWPVPSLSSVTGDSAHITASQPGPPQPPRPNPTCRNHSGASDSFRPRRFQRVARLPIRMSFLHSMTDGCSHVRITNSRRHTRTFWVCPPRTPHGASPETGTAYWALGVCRAHTRSLAHSHRQPRLAGQGWASEFESGWAMPRPPCPQRTESRDSRLVNSSLLRLIPARPTPAAGRHRALG